MASRQNHFVVWGTWRVFVLPIVNAISIVTEDSKKSLNHQGFPSGNKSYWRKKHDATSPNLSRVMPPTFPASYAKLWTASVVCSCLFPHSYMEKWSALLHFISLENFYWFFLFSPQAELNASLSVLLWHRRNNTFKQFQLVWSLSCITNFLHGTMCPQEQGIWICLVADI